MDRFNFYRGQVVAAADMDAAFAAIERQFWDRGVDMQLFGVVSGLVPTLGTAPNLNVTKGIAFDQLGRRVRAYSDGASTKSQSYSTTTAGASTSVTSGQERWISIYARYGQKGSDPRLDSGSAVNFDLLECLNSNDTSGGVDKFYIIAGSSAPTGTATRPALDTDKVLICDIKRTPSDASNVLDTSRRAVGGLSASGFQIGALTAWAGGRTNPATTLQAVLDRYITDLAAQTASDDGCERIGAQASGGLSAGSLRSQLDTLDLRASLSASQTWTGQQTWSRGTPTTQFAHRYPQASGFRLISGVDGSGSTDGGVRVYIEGNGRLLLTTNAVWSGSAWDKDVTARESMAIVIGALSGGTKHHLAICWRATGAGTWNNTFGISTGWDRVLDLSGTDADWLGGLGGSLGANVGATLVEVQKGDVIGNVNGVVSDVYWIGVATWTDGVTTSTLSRPRRVMPFRHKWDTVPTAGTINNSPSSALIATGSVISIAVLNSIVFEWEMDQGVSAVPIHGCATVTFTQ